jgi:hypothetical protein
MEGVWEPSLFNRRLVHYTSRRDHCSEDPFNTYDMQEPEYAHHSMGLFIYFFRHFRLQSLPSWSLLLLSSTAILDNFRPIAQKIDMFIFASLLQRALW